VINILWKVLDPQKTAPDLAEYHIAINWASKTALRDVIDKTMLLEMLEGTDKISNYLQKIINECTDIPG